MNKRSKDTKKLPSFLQTCHERFGSYNLYDVLGVTKEATPQEVKKGYHKTSLAVHPDRVKEGEKEIATQKFQTLGKVYSILSDKDRRALYDETGDVGDESVIDEERDWCQYWRLLFPKITVQDIQKFESEYRGSPKEIEDLKTAYLNAEGEMDEIMANMLCSTFEDEPRFTLILKELIQKDSLPDFTAFSKEAKKKKKARQKKASKEALEAEQEAKRLKLDSNDSLTALIKKRNESRVKQAESFFDNLEAKYVKQKASRSKTSKKK